MKNNKTYLKRALPVAAIAATCVSALMLSGCGVVQHTDVNNSTGKITKTAECYYNAGEAAAFAKSKEKTIEEIFNAVKINGGTYYLAKDGSSTEVTTIEKSELANNQIILDKNKYEQFVSSSTTSSSSSNSSSSSSSNSSSSSSSNSSSSSFEFVSVTTTFTKKPITSNGKISGNTVTWNANAKGLQYVTFTKAAAKCKKVSYKGAEKNASGGYTLRFKTKGVITKFTVDGKKQAVSGLLTASTPSGGKTAYKYETNTCNVKKKGKHKIKVKLSSGYSKTFKIKVKAK